MIATTKFTQTEFFMVLIIDQYDIKSEVIVDVILTLLTNLKLSTIKNKLFIIIKYVTFKNCRFFKLLNY